MTKYKVKYSVGPGYTEYYIYKRVFGIFWTEVENRYSDDRDHLQKMLEGFKARATNLPKDEKF